MVPSGRYCGISSMYAMATRVTVKAEGQIKTAYESYASSVDHGIAEIAPALRSFASERR